MQHDITKSYVLANIYSKVIMMTNVDSPVRFIPAATGGSDSKLHLWPWQMLNKQNKTEPLIQSLHQVQPSKYDAESSNSVFMSPIVRCH